MRAGEGGEGKRPPVRVLAPTALQSGGARSRTIRGYMRTSTVSASIELISLEAGADEAAVCVVADVIARGVPFAFVDISKHISSALHPSWIAKSSTSSTWLA